MKGILTETEAMQEIFNKQRLSSTMRTFKRRYKLGILSQKSVNYLLQENNYTVIQPILYKLKTKKIK